MLPKLHFLYSLAISLVLYPLLKEHTLIFFAATILVDFDHYFIYAIKKNDLSLRNAYLFLKNLERKQKNPEFKGRYTFFLCALHTAEFMLLLFLLSFLNKIVLVIFLAFVLHLFLDIMSTRMEFNNKYFSYYLAL